MPTISNSYTHPYQYNILVHDNGGTQCLHGLDNLLSVLLGDVLLHHLGCALDELLAVHQAQAQHVLDLLDDLGLEGGIESLELEGEESLLGGGGSSLLGLLDGGRGSGASSGETSYGHIGDVELGL